MFVPSFIFLFHIYFFGFAKYYFKTKKRSWNTFTRVISTINALQCIIMTSYFVYNFDSNVFSLHYLPSSFQTNSLFIFSSYLFVDGIFQLPDFLYVNFSLELVLSILHHFVGGYGIYLIAKSEMGFFLGFYFAMTEISTPFLNLSWYFRKDFLLYIFYAVFSLSRIGTMGILIDYISQNSSIIDNLEPIQTFMVYFGSYTLTLLNFLWFLFLTQKVIFTYL